MVVRSRLLARLDGAIALSRTAVDSACLRAERAAFLGRHGQMELAKRELQEIQRRFSQEPHVAVSGWLALAEGQLVHYSGANQGAFEYFQRAHALSTAARLRPLQAVSAAWLAHSYDAREDHARMATLSAEALALAAPDDHAARWRACLTVGSAYHYGRRLDLAQPWYDAARRHALADGDEVALSALMYNRAGLGGDHARLVAAFGVEADGDAALLHALMGTESTTHFDKAIGVQSLEWLAPLVRAQILVLQKRFEDALATLNAEGAATESEWFARMEACFLADRAWCLFNTGHPERARMDAERAAQGLPESGCPIEDRALAHARLSQAFDVLGEPERAAMHRRQGEADYAVLRDAQRGVVALLDQALAGRLLDEAG